VKGALQLVLALSVCASRVPAQQADPQWQLSRSDRIRIAEARRLSAEVGDLVWPGLGAAKMPILLVTDSVEFLVGRAGSEDGFGSVAYDTLLRDSVATRARRLDPKLLATFPVAGEPTIVIGTPERTRKSSTEWVLTLIHEHFHQWQYTRPGYYRGVAGLELSGGDSTGMWMLNYAFPYDSARIQLAVRHWATALRRALGASSSVRVQTLERVTRARDRLRNLVSPPDYRYVEFQLWQEGVARYVEYRAVVLAAQKQDPPKEFRALPDYQPYNAAASEMHRRLLRELDRLDLGRDRRVSFYPIGAAIALLLDQVQPWWKEAYSARPFVLASLLRETS
jgi:hypothetical protein